VPCQPLDALRPGDIAAAHASLAPTNELIEQRRAVYEAVLELLLGYSPAVSDSQVLDNPMVRGHLGVVLSGGGSLDRTRLRPLSDLTTETSVFTVAGLPIRLAAADDAQVALADALRRIAVQVDGDRPRPRPPRVITNDRPAFTTAHNRVRDGAQLASRVAPELVGDLLPHVALVAVLDAATSGRLGSASVREYPGLVLMPAPTSALEAAEALIHEGAHQRFFDLAITRAMFGANQFSAPDFRPSWAAADAPHWPLEQTFAAFHAYCCLAAFADALSTRRELRTPRSSLLPVAPQRAAEIGDWLVRHGEFVGVDGHSLISGLLGQHPRGHPAPAPPTSSPEHTPEDQVLVRHVRGRTLVARRSTMELFWTTP